MAVVVYYYILFIMVSREHRRRRLRRRCRRRPMTVEKQSVAQEVGAIDEKLFSRKKSAVRLSRDVLCFCFIDYFSNHMVKL